MPKRILIAEDEVNIGLALSYLLENAGFEVTVVHDGEQALDAIRQAVPDILLLDLMLPSKNGYDVLRHLRSESETADLPVVVLTAKGQRQDREAALEAGATCFISKPFSNADVVQAIQRLSQGDA